MLLVLWCVSVGWWQKWNCTLMRNHVLTSRNGETLVFCNTSVEHMLGFEALMCGDAFFSTHSNMIRSSSLEQQKIIPCTDLVICSYFSPGCQATLPDTFAGLRHWRAPPGTPPTSWLLFNPVENCSHFLRGELGSQRQLDGCSQGGCDRQSVGIHLRQFCPLDPMWCEKWTSVMWRWMLVGTWQAMPERA